MSEPEHKVADVMSSKVATVELDATVRDCAKMMAKRGGSSAVIVQSGQATGIITERDLVSKVLADALDPSKVLVQDIMSTPLITIGPGATLAAASALMVEYRVRRLVVLDATGSLAGIITTGDIARSLAKKHHYEEPTFNAMARYKEGAEAGPYQ